MVDFQIRVTLHNTATDEEKEEWLDLEDYSSVDEIEEYLNSYFDSEESATWELGVFDVDGAEFNLDSLEEVWEFYEFLSEDDYNVEAKVAYANQESVEECMKNFEEAYNGTFDSGAEFAEQLVEDVYSKNDLPDFVTSHIDWKGVWRELQYDYSEVKDSSGNIHIFRQL